MENKKVKKWLLFIAATVLIEVFICNCQFWITHLFYPKETVYTTNEIQFGGGFLVNGTEVSVNTKENCTIILNEINQNVKSLYLDIDRKDMEEKVNEKNPVSCYLSIMDEGNMAGYYSVPSNGASHKIVSTEKNSKWIRLHPYGILNSVQITLDQEQIQEGDKFQINGITVNGKHPINISLLRMVIILVIMVFISVFRGSSMYYAVPFSSLSKRKRNYLVGCLVVCQILMFGIMGQVTFQYSKQYYSSGSQEYYWLTESLAKGQTWLDQEPPQYLQEMENPYDTSMRYQKYAETGQWYVWDSAYYEGKYYVYFGVIPVLLFYLPYFLLTGKMVSNLLVVFLAAAISVILLARFLKVMAERYFPRTSVLTYILLFFGSGAALGFVNLFRSVQVYEVAIAVGLMFVMAGLDLWIESVDGKKILSKRKLFFGSLCMASVAGTRPNLILVAFVAFIIFRKFLIEDKKLCIQKHIKLLGIFLIPFVFVAAGLMYYNYIRFGSPFDFGVSYNLTTNDVTNRGFAVGRLPIGIFEYLFSPLVVNGIFPYIHNKNVVSEYMGMSIVESMAGGIFFLAPICFYCLIPWIRKTVRKDYSEWAFCSMMLAVIGVVLAALDTSSGGILSRYQADMAMFFILAAILSIFIQEDIYMKRKEASENTTSESVVLWHNLLVVAVVLTVVLGYLFFFLPYRDDSMDVFQPKFYYGVKYLIEFWK